MWCVARLVSDYHGWITLHPLTKQGWLTTNKIFRRISRCIKVKSVVLTQSDIFKESSTIIAKRFIILVVDYVITMRFLRLEQRSE